MRPHVCILNSLAYLRNKFNDNSKRRPFNSASYMDSLDNILRFDFGC